MSGVRVYGERGPKKRAPLVLRDDDVFAMRIETDSDAVETIGRLYVTSTGIQWFPKGVMKPPKPEAYSISWSRLSSLVQGQGP